MKYIHYYFAFIIVLLPGKYHLYSNNLFTNNSHIDLYMDSSNTSGLDIKFPLGELKFSFQNEKYNVGITATSSQLTNKYPITIKTGNLSFSGILSKMNNPLLSSPNSPFSLDISAVSAINANLPGMTSFTKPLSSFIEFTYKNKASIFSEIKINSFYTPEDSSAAVSFFSKLSLFNNQLKIQNACIAGFFSYEDNSFSSWFSNNPYYHQDNHFCSYYQLSIALKKFLTGFSTGIYETPFGTLASVYRIDNKFSSNHFVLLLSAFINQNCYINKVLTSSDKELKDCFQMRMGIQYKFVTGIKTPVYIKTAFQSFGNINLSENEDSLKFSAGIQFSSNLTALSITSCLNLIETSSNGNSYSIHFDSVTAQIRNTWYTKAIIPSITLSVSYNPDSAYTSYTNTYKIASSLNFYSNPKISSNASFTITQKDEQIKSKKLSGSLSCKFNWKKINFIIKLSGNIEM